MDLSALFQSWCHGNLEEGSDLNYVSQMTRGHCKDRQVFQMRGHCDTWWTYDYVDHIWDALFVYVCVALFISLRDPSKERSRDR